ncbi:MAG: single-stranded-DNA-specific exonuclease RecJ [Firmicutes bacterium]|nr:single-stranded-DNA-specific exonuclease RecJ [Bacillota bacterium]
MDKKSWIMYPQDPEAAGTLGRELGVSPLAAQLMINRGVVDKRDGLQYLECSLDTLPDPFQMLDMDKAVNRIERALADGERIVVYGDYDVDGQTAAALLVHVFSTWALEPSLISYYIPNRLDEGYGLNMAAVEKLAEQASLLITVDCGITSYQEVELAQELGLDIIITDHHQPSSLVPNALAVLNPKREQCMYPEKELAGVGVAFKLVQALSQRQDLDFTQYLDLVALGTVADLVPLLGENRILVKHGLAQMSVTKRPGLKALLHVSDVEEPTAGDLGFRLGPRLNAVGRMGDPSRGVELLLATQMDRAVALAEELDKENRLRQDTEDSIVEQAVAVVEQYNLHEQPAIVVWGNGWHQGVIGIAASRLVEKYYRPTIVISLQDGIGTGSARSISGFHLYHGLEKCQDLLVRFGGHAMAAGLTIREGDLLEFQKRFVRLCDETLKEEDFIPKLMIDAQVSLDSISEELVNELALLEPYGIGNPGPTLQVNASVIRWRKVGRDQRHLQCTLQDETNCQLPAIGFGFAQYEEEIEDYQENLSFAFVPGINEWNNQRTIQLQLKALDGGQVAPDYVRKWQRKVHHNSWAPPYLVSKALITEPSTDRFPTIPAAVVDLRGVWNKTEALLERQSRLQPTLILVSTPRETVEVCRHLRIHVPGGSQFIAFDHELLSHEERSELADFRPTWLVSTGYSGLEQQWPSVWFWRPPLHEANACAWFDLVKEGGEVVLAFGPRDRRELERYLGEVYPDRLGMARIYSHLRQLGEEIPYSDAQQMLERLGLASALPFAIGVFTELNLWKIDDGVIVYQPIPAKKLDLHKTVLYNKGITIRRQSSNYLKHCLERGLFQDGLKREN